MHSWVYHNTTLKPFDQSGIESNDVNVRVFTTVKYYQCVALLYNTLQTCICECAGSSFEQYYRAVEHIHTVFTMRIPKYICHDLILHV